MHKHNQSEGFFAQLRLIGKRGRQVWGLVPARHKWALAGAGLVMACTSLCNTALPLLLGQMLDTIQHGLTLGEDTDSLTRAAIWFLALLAGAYVLREAFNVLRRLLVENTCTRINRDMSVHLVDHLLKVDLATLSKNKVGALQGRIFQSVDGLVRFLRLSFLDFIPVILTGLFALAAALYKQPLLGLVMVGVMPVAVLLTVRQLISQKGVRLQLMRSCEDIAGAVTETLGGMEYVRAANTHEQEVKRLARTTEKRRAKEVRHHFQMSLFGCGKALNEGFFHVVVLGFAVALVIRREASIGDVLMFSVLFLNVMAPLSEIHRILDEGQESSLRVGDLLELLAEPVDRSFAVARAQEPRLRLQEHAIVVEQLQVEYLTPTGKQVRALDGLSLSVRHGETLGVVGRSGCGKTTWIKVLLRLIHPCGGTALVGGVPLEEVSREEIGRLIGYVGQTPFVFSGNIAENIAYGNGHPSLDAIREAARMANLHDEIMLMPGGYHARITERGQNLSGGQRQRLALARILLKQPPILILDEATSALDNISERHVQQALGLPNRNRTTILVAHRLSTLVDADRIVVFADGRIVETGTYDELVHQGGLFAELAMSGESSAAVAGPHSHLS